MEFAKITVKFPSEQLIDYVAAEMLALAVEYNCIVETKHNGICLNVLKDDTVTDIVNGYKQWRVTV